MATAKMKIILPLVVWISWLQVTTAQSFGGIGFGIKREVFFLNLEDGYFGCQVNESTDVLQLFELSKLCDGTPNCFLGSDELAKELKCTDDCRKDDGTECQNGACLDGQCHCNDGFGSCNCEVPDENECKYRPCDVFAHCTNTLGSFSCTCFPGYHGDGFHCEDINECEDPAIADRCVENAECCNLPAHFLCKCNPGYEGDGEVQCHDIDECLNPNACGPNAVCLNSPGNYSCKCAAGMRGDPHSGCVDVDECLEANACAPGALCHNAVGGRECYCPPGYEGDAYAGGCRDVDECARADACGRHAECRNLEGSFRCTCPPGYIGDPITGCDDVSCHSHSECQPQQACINKKCQNPCTVSNPCSQSQDCQVQDHQPVCVKVCQCQRHEDCGNNPSYRCDGCKCIIEQARIPQCPNCPPGVPCDPLTGACSKASCTRNEDCSLSEACIDYACQKPCDKRNPCAQHATCINTNHGSDCLCEEGFQGNGYVGCVPVIDYKPICQYNEDCPPNKLCDRLNRICINPCFEDSCGENAECLPKDHGIECRCLGGFHGNPYTECLGVQGCRSDGECEPHEACINGQCASPCRCGMNAICDVVHHVANCKCPPGYVGNALEGCQPPSNPCNPNPCGLNALCELDNGNPICFCPKGLTGNPFKNCIPEGDECAPNPCGPNSGCRVVGGNAVCFCLPEYEGTPPQTPCALPSNPCDPSPCGPNTQCTILSNGFAKCTCLPGFLESPNTIRGCVESKNPCEPNPCGQGARCNPLAEPVCSCPAGTVGNPFRNCGEPQVTALCSPGPCGVNSDCYVSNNQEQCYCRPGFIGDPYSGCRLEPASPCMPNPCGLGAHCVVTLEGQSMCRCPEGMGGDPTGPAGCHGYECVVDGNCQLHEACIGYRCKDPCPGSCGANANCRVEQHHPVCTCDPGCTGNPDVRCFPLPVPMPVENPCMPSPCGTNTLCQVISGRAVCSCLPDFQGDPQFGCRPECVLNSDCPISKACLDRHCVDPCSIHNLCGIHANCQVRDHTATCVCPQGYIGDPFSQCVYTPPVTIPTYPNVTAQPCLPSPCGSMECNIYGTQVAICDPCLGPKAAYDPRCRPECLTNADCPFDKACLGLSCVDPCPGSCGVNAYCNVVQHTPVCSCPQGLFGDPFQHCSVPLRPEPHVETCESVSCGANADCKQLTNALSCVCKPGFFGNPWIACRPECVVNPDCPLQQACINNKCIDPCGGVCGNGAHCEVTNHIPVCYCPPESTGNPFVSCHAHKPNVEVAPSAHPCDPSPCGPFSRCMISHQGFATCSCLPNYQGAPPACKPECIVSSECSQMRACVNQKCVDPCVGSCGANALCTVINHNPICSCTPGQQGDPFVNCYSPPVSESPKDAENPCVPSPCGPNSLCQVKEDRPVCSCQASYVGSPPYCRPECTINPECPKDKACVREKCMDPCIELCGRNAKCDIVNHNAFCSCLPGFEGDAFVGCSRLPAAQPKDPCNPSPCGANSQCSVSAGVARCVCIPPYVGNPYVSGCRPECMMNSDCASHLACLSQHCRDPCRGLCGLNAECSVVNHVPVCACGKGMTGDPFTACRERLPEAPINPCEPSPCGPNSVCRVRNDQAICSCQVGYFGTPPTCRPECLVSSECSADRACINQKCVDPCPETCGVSARCQVNNHNPICSCPVGYVGDPFVQCTKMVKPPRPTTPCIPSPCGANAECRAVGSRAVCSCLPDMFGAPPNCRPECLIDQDCPLNLACSGNRCKDPCRGVCGFNTQCRAVNHKSICSCLAGFEGDPFSGCSPVTATERTPPSSPCFPSPCGPNAECREKNGAGACVCPAGYQGDPYDSSRGCRRECETNDDCLSHRACVTYKCIDPCPGTCGSSAECRVNNHAPTCSCPPGLTGDPFFQCKEIPAERPRVPENPCQPSPCGPNSQCKQVNEQAVCSCLPTYMGSPPNCRPECVVSSECSPDRACINQKCSDPCPNTCGLGAQCTTKNHNPICACPPGYTGDPFLRCSPQPVIEEPTPTERPPSCHPSPCGPNAQCKIIGNTPSCSCSPNFIGSPPNCRPECVLNTDCNNQQACINQKCRDPCPGSCGINAKCHIINHLPICTCLEGHTGDPFTQCNLIPPVVTQRPTDPCNPSPCGPNAECVNGVCSCLPEYLGNPYESCRPECVLSTECSRDKACVRNKCKDPCPGTCGQNARCDVINHIPTCSCPDAFTGDPFTSCRVAEEPPTAPLDPCNPSPCGPNSQCRNVNNQAVCSCIQGYQGSPPSCRPECLSGSECPQNRACVNQKCIDPCPGSCGVNARCEVRNHSPICSCQEGQTGDPFQSCREMPKEAPPTIPRNPCEPSPCGPNSECRVAGESPSCSCRPDYVGNPPNCRPECVISSDCSSTEACVNNKCRDPCPGSCGVNAECRVITHTVSCSCPTGFSGNPFVQCVPHQEEPPNPCEPSPCGPNAECKQRNGAGSCVCIRDYQGNPYEGCRPECVLSSDCPANKACIRNKCGDPCPGVCGQNAECSVINHVPACTCINGYTGDPFVVCSPAPPLPTEPTIVDPCSPNPCGRYSQCRNVNDQAVCSCLPEYTGSPPNCKPECVVSSECPPNRACHKFKCANPCTSACGVTARCEVINHNPICSCPSGLTGDPFVRCYELPPPPPPTSRPSQNPCVPSPCGPNSECRVVGDQPSCSCRVNYMGSPPNCRPECVVNTDCPSDLACITEKCRDPCPGSCGFNADCRIQNHIPICTCSEGFAGDAFTECTRLPPPKENLPVDPCNPSPCGANTQCDGGACSCLPLYLGDPYVGCRPECTMNTDCSPKKSCNNMKCVDPCPGTCGQGAVCDVVNHIPSCSCPSGQEGDPFTICRPIKKIETPQNPCQPSPCGPNSVCRVNNGVAVCSCQPTMVGSPPSCRPECLVSAECPLTQACLNKKCVDPCPGTCGLNTRCQVINHNPICSCTQGNTGDPFVRCYPLPKEEPIPLNPCDPSPCGPNSVCLVRGESPACSCRESYVGIPPNCRPECTINPECTSDRACVNQRCRDPCVGGCGPNAECRVVNHNAVCSCRAGFTGDPFQGCLQAIAPPQQPPKKEDPCFPSPCGSNAQCRVENGYAVCECLPEYHGNPYESCRPECLSNADCSMDRACIRNKCVDPCPGTCGTNALCFVTNHVPVCSCPDRYTGDAFRLCTPVIVEPPRDPCNPSPCGLNTICRKSGENAICECLPGFFGTPSAGGCRPECTISADCERTRACVNTKCVDPCPGVCGFGAVCNVVNHSPVCSCPLPLVGDPFTLCRNQPEEEPRDPCNPSPCDSNGQCRVVNGLASCSYPECVINQDCPRDKACYSQKCRSPCSEACGLNALCQVVNHQAVCSCPPGYIGAPEVQCRYQIEEKPRVECTQDSECTNDKACIDNQCVNPCSAGVCGQNAECRPQLHRAVCTCRDGFTGNAQRSCYELGCRSDSECPPTQACINRDCVDPCSFTSCGLNALCRADANHKARCYCPDSFRGDPLVRCERPECTVNEDCPYNLACNNERCADPCNCGLGALCSVTNHRPQCSCSPGYTGNPLASCRIEAVTVEPQCTADANCPNKLACFDGICKNPCYETKPCGKNTECIVVDSLPLRTMSCMCLPGYVGDADTECKPAPQEKPGCRSNDECSSSETCLNRQCVNPCAIGNPCSPTADCRPTDHKAVCRCPSGLIGDPFIKCYQPPQIKPECTADSECPNDRSCINQRCQDPCYLANPCGSAAECRTNFHRPTCLCPDGWLGNPQIMCYKPECKTDRDCPYDRACISDNCVDPCSTQSCGRGANCLVQNHLARCQCPAGTQGDPLLSCITGICHYNEDCAEHEACDRLNRVCRPVCDDDTCAETASCVGIQHQPKCRCPPGTKGNPFVQCLGQTTPSEPECRTDAECSSTLACVNSRCQNPCALESVCTPDQECRVLDTLPLRTIMCQCPPDTIVDASGRCVPVALQKPQCQVDSDCSNSDKCIGGSCIQACRVDRCGVNALCNPIDHQAICSCAPGYTGNARYECSNIPKRPFEVMPPECYVDEDCPYDKTCRRDYCVNPCSEENPCSFSAFCSVNDHRAVCKCPAGYEGNPHVECIAPLGPTVGCTSNSECPQSQSCVNRLCISPCNCGPNAECHVTDHYPICYCRAGYSGNPQIGCTKLGCQSDTECPDDKQCYNGQCVNPCILADPCARNAECYGQEHRSSCRCQPGYEGNALDRCERVECHVDLDCPNNRACLQQRCVDPCSTISRPPCAQNAICYAQNHAAGCVCPPHLPQGNPLSFCTAPTRPAGKPECETDPDCPSKLACIRNKCVSPCSELSPCHSSTRCSVLDTVPVRTMICTCPEGWVPNENGECHAVIVPIPPGCTADDNCPDDQACINRLCRNPCDCGTNAQCLVRDHRAVCSCRQGFDGNPNIACQAVGCRIDSECGSGRACLNGHCIDPCLVRDRCGANAECFVYQNRAECRCAAGYRGDPLERCSVIGCTSNSDCPGDKQCINAQCINPCVYDNPCSPRAECMVNNHLPLCRCPDGLIGNPYVDCRPEPRPECKEDSECPSRLACLNNKCRDPCVVLEPCQRPAECQVVGSIPVRTMICVCPPGYISSGSGTCNPVTAVTVVGACASDEECPAEKACFNGICRNPCNCGPDAECRVKNHKPVCACKEGFGGNPELECTRVGCRSDDDCSGHHSCVNRQCVAACAADGSTCGQKATCYGVDHRAICECPPGLMGDPRIACVLVGCRSDSDCPGSRACINNKCELPCVTANPCDAPAECKSFDHVMECVCPPGTIGDGGLGCVEVEEKCRRDSECPSQFACIGGECVNPCKESNPCGVNAECTVLNTEPVRTMICQCLPGYEGNAAVICNKTALCRIDKGYVRSPDGRCVCAPNTALNENDECVHCPVDKGLKVDERGRCVCALERGLIIDERGNCVCPVEFGYRLDFRGNCVPNAGPECETDGECPEHRYCNPGTKTCDDPCAETPCGVNALCNATDHRAVCQCITGYTGNPDVYCNHTSHYKTDFPRPDLTVSCLSDGVQVEITLSEIGFNGILYVKGHSKDEKCRRVVSIDSGEKIEYFKVNFGSCGLIHVNGEASFVLVIQKHPKLVTYKAQAYHIKCVYQTGEQNVTLGFNVSMLTTAGTIANTGPPPTCLMKIVTPTGKEINSAEIGDNLMLQVDVQPGSIYGGFARSCVAKTMGDSVENEYLVTDEDGCATDPTIFGEWEYNPDTQSLMASFNAFKFPSSDNIRFQCNIRVCFGKCQPVNCRGYNAFGRRKRSVEGDNENDTDVAVGGDLLSGQLREEITIQSNAILTLERREERYPDPQTAPKAQRAQEICVSMIGFIIALIITALLALVAVAVAVSCWLMAYRRRPKEAGPLPHPPEFPNPLFTAPEPAAEPSPDYLT